MTTQVRRPGIGIGAFVFHQNKLLMLRRVDTHGDGTWAIPGGKPDWGESPEAAAEREVLEETGVTVRAVRRLPYTDDFHPEWDVHFVTLFIECEYVAGEPVVREAKCQNVAWVLLGGVHCRELFPPLAHFLADNPGYLRELADRSP